MEQSIQINADFIEQETNFGELVELLREGFATREYVIPQRSHHNFPNPKTNKESTLLMMPAWNPGKEAGVKVVTVNPGNGDLGLPAIQGSYLYLDATTGVLRAVMEAKSLTAKRTAATSALASSFLSRTDASSMLMIGTGALSVNLIRAHGTVRPIEQVFVWGRNLGKAEMIAKELTNKNFNVIPVSTIEEKISGVDIVSCATLSAKPLIHGDMLVPGQHIDLVGAFKPNMRESDNAVMARASIYLDSLESGLEESGDIAIPIQENVIESSDIQGDLFNMCSAAVSGRKSNEEITLFKSVGHALEDLVAAKYYYSKYRK
ncbi:ornithine cyclodeaminase family protein [Flagellimonas flava]|uniref:Ornithine cyclodeaminase n=1 Tax=Flagellimonas flava TaxID=570519 RepID=A0A1M5NAA3_9FLAO|nr:ornithine cyclodeaminase family protein [Allomuricauda flava]SHG86438.1 ornithine cyclodeaminase [Allomuricauda flava]